MIGATLEIVFILSWKIASQTK